VENDARQSPFNCELINIGFGRITRIRGLEGKPEKIVRVDVSHYDSELNKIDPLYSEFFQSRIVLDQIRERTGIHTPKMHSVIGFDPELGQDVLFTVVERIHGVDLADKVFSEQEIPQAAILFDRLFIDTCNYLLDIYDNGGWWKHDLMDLTQYVWGRGVDDSEDRLYMVDVDPQLSLSLPKSNTVLNYGLGVFGSLGWSNIGSNKIVGIYPMLDALESKLGINLNGTRAKLLEFIDHALIASDDASDTYKEEMQQVQKRLIIK
jgi:hypothetical protein